MCCCEKPNVNGQPGYRWQPNHQPGTRPVDPPKLDEHDVLLYDEPGRCCRNTNGSDGMDSHSHHYRLVRYCGVFLLVQHGGGQERLRVSTTSTLMEALEKMDSDTRYWTFNAIFHAHSYAKSEAREKANQRWAEAAREKRIKVRRNGRVEILDRTS